MRNINGFYVENSGQYAGEEHKILLCSMRVRQTAEVEKKRH
jgi:hypothetical protein